MDGLLVVDKPQGKSSHDIVYAIRRLTGEARVGHAGTLDPMATGVLILCVGQAVRISEYLIDHAKTYRARVKLGIETDSYDATGRILATRAVNVTATQIQTALDSFVGKIFQTPPAFSALKVEGVRQYKLARRGETVVLEPRAVEIYSIDVREFADAEVEFDVACSKGTYIRSLAHDLGAKLETGAHLIALRRLASGPFTLEQAHTLDELRAAFARFLIPLDRGLMQFDAVHLDDAEAKAVVTGREIRAREKFSTALVRAYAPNGQCLALLQVQNDILKPHKVFGQLPFAIAARTSD